MRDIIQQGLDDPKNEIYYMIFPGRTLQMFVENKTRDILNLKFRHRKLVAKLQGLRVKIIFGGLEKV